MENQLTLINPKYALRYNTVWYGEYRCSCGKIKIAANRDVRSGATWHCGCLKIKPKTYEHIKHRSMLTLIRERVKKDSSKMWMNEYLCECGNKTLSTRWRVETKITISCGCFRKKRLLESVTKHGFRKEKLYPIWVGMKQRCDNPKNQSYNNYGGRGITYSLEWKEYPAFREWAMSNGYKHGLTIERNNVDGNYESNNCSWIPKNHQGRNLRKSIPADKIEKILSESREISAYKVAKKYSVCRSTVDRLRMNKRFKNENA